MISLSKLETLFERIVDAISISEEMFNAAEAEYKKMGEWIKQNTPSYEIEIYPQGSFALGTVVQPYGREDEYDLDLVCEYQKDYGFTARQLKKVEMRSILDRYGRAKSILERKRCWKVTYQHNTHFHMDIVPAVLQDSFIQITNHNEEKDTYDYIGSNPRAYANWFRKKQQIQYDTIKRNLQEEAKKNSIVGNAEIVPIKEYRIKTTLQKTILILKRHRDLLFANDNNHLKPISIIITTLAAELYRNEDTIIDTLRTFFANAKQYIEQNMIGDQYYIPNPTFTGEKIENFAEKWNEHPERAETFLDWLETAEHDLLDSLTSAQNDSEIAIIIKSALGDKVASTVFGETKSALIEAECKQSENGIVPFKVQQVLCAPQKQRLPFKCPERIAVFIKATVTDEYGLKYDYNNDGNPIPKNSQIEFRACFGGIRKPYTIQWQVVNMGIEAQRAGDLRGQLEPPTNKPVKIEYTRYTGSHSIQCFILKHGCCVAKSRIFIVNVK